MYCGWFYRAASAYEQVRKSDGQGNPALVCLLKSQAKSAPDTSTRNQMEVNHNDVKSNPTCCVVCTVPECCELLCSMVLSLLSYLVNVVVVVGI